MASRTLRTDPALITGLVVTLVVALTGLVGLTTTAQALTCPPGLREPTRVRRCSGRARR